MNVHSTYTETSKAKQQNFSTIQKNCVKPKQEMLCPQVPKARRAPIMKEETQKAAARNRGLLPTRHGWKAGGEPQGCHVQDL